MCMFFKSKYKRVDSEIMQQKQKAANEKPMQAEENDDYLENLSFPTRCIISCMTKILQSEQSITYVITHPYTTVYFKPYLSA